MVINNLMMIFPNVVCALLVSLCLLVSARSVDLNQNKGSTEEESNRLNISKCSLCELFSEAFDKAMQRTSRNSFGGGDTAWEEKNLGSYSTSETRLVEIQEHLCDGDPKIKTVCTTLAEIWEHHLENWWFRDRKSFPDFKIYLCIVTTKSCNSSQEAPRTCPIGYAMDFKKNCLDVNECLANPCQRHEFCINNEGSYSCEFCHANCETCYGPGPRRCKTFRNKVSKEPNVVGSKNIRWYSINLKIILVTIPILVVAPCVYLLKNLV